ncbi:MAG TPA: sigma-70 family RNA polymerase sigma factor [Candidatus Limnocylindria bacterium]|jgi:RNA polymerase sigma factor (sigma-70 family)|nr:sigma-70 family RNA polymerase sigma factor [Candidatus Limnocylindria bacterium]
MTSPDNELLRRFAADRSEPDFTALVDRHVGLVYSAALRQVGGDNGAAEDVTQAVFADLARKAARLTGHTSLTGWLYTSTRYLAANVRRDEQRRRQREQEALMMDRLLQPADPAPDWDQLRPVLDEAMHELSEADREAVLLRFFERRPLAAVGEQLGLNENAARMRVDRALDKLRKALARRGVTSTAVALGLALAERTLAEVPAGLSQRISHAAITGAAAGGGLIFTLLTLMAHTKTKVLIAAAVAALLLTPAVRPWFAAHTDSAKSAAPKVSASGPAQPSALATGPLAEADRSGVTATAVADDPSQGRLKLTLLTADTGKPVPNVEVTRGWVTDAKFLSQRDGIVRVTYPKTTKELRLTTHMDGFADTCLKWSLERGEAVPEAYTVRLERAVPIGGTVADAEGKPVAGAKVGFNHEEDPAAANRTESHDFGWIQVTTDERGRWRIDRMAADILRRIYGSASHPDHVGSPLVFVARDPIAEPALRAEKYVFRLRAGVTVTGTVVDTSGNPVAEATVRVGRVGDGDSREGKSGADGSFELHGCQSGNQLVSAGAKGYAPTTETAQLAADSAPVRLVLKPGSILRLRIVGQDGQPVPKANIWLDTLNQGRGFPGESQATPVQADVELRSDADGRVVWAEAPDADLTFDISASGHFRVDGYKVRPDGQEHTVTLPNALTIFGTVRDSQSGAAVPKFRIMTGWPQVDYPNGTTNPSWSRLERFTLSFGGGEFRHTFEEGVIGGMKNPGYVFRVEADGYAPLITRTVAAEEGEARLDISLRPARATTVALVQPDGRPAPNAALALVSAGGNAKLAGVSFDPLNSQGSILITTDREGHFQLPNDDSLVLILAAHPEGFATARPAEFVVGQTTWMLQPWGKIEGTWLSGDKPAVGRDLLLESVEGRRGALQFDFTTFKATTDGEGRFRYDHVPPGQMKLTRLIRSEMGTGHTSWGHGRSTEVEVRAGEATPVTLGGTGYRVAAAVTWTDGKKSNLPWQFGGSVHTPMPLPPPEMEKNPEAMQRWWAEPAHQQAAKAAKFFQMAQQPDGTLLAEEVEPGNYVVDLGAFALNSEGKPQANARAEQIPLFVPESPATGLINVGVIPLHTESGGH